MGHVYVTPVGFGKRIIAVGSPFTCARRPADKVLVTLGSKPLVVSRDLAPAEGLSPDCEVADVVAGPTLTDWFIHAGPYLTPFPAGWTVDVPGGISPAFFLVGTQQDTVFVETATNVPREKRLVAPHESLVADGTSGPFEWVEVSYSHEGRTWRQRRTVVGVEGSARGVVFAQAPTENFQRARELQRTIAEGVVFNS
jgi:hypothetical protein